MTVAAVETVASPVLSGDAAAVRKSPRFSRWSARPEPWGPWAPEPTPHARAAAAAAAQRRAAAALEDAPPAPFEEEAAVDLWRVGLLHPRSAALRAWRAFVSALALYWVIITPWDAGFCFDSQQAACTGPALLDGCYPRELADADVAVSLLLWLDVAVQLRTARGAPGGRAVPSWRPAFDAYATAWLLPDLVSVLPFGSAVAARAAAAGAAPAVSLLKLGKAARMLRARHLWEGRPGGAAAGAAPAGPLTRLLALMAVFLLMTHWGACAMWALSRWQVEDGGPGCGVSAETGLAPLALFDGRLARNVTYGADANAAQALACASRTLPSLTLPAGTEWSLYCADLRTKYVAMAYYTLITLATTGYGDIAPGTSSERVLAVALELAGCVSCAVVFGNAAAALAELDRAGARLRSRLAQLARLCGHYTVPPPLAARLAEFATEQWRSQLGLCPAPGGAAHGGGGGLLPAGLPPALGDAVLAELAVPVVRGSALFGPCPPGLVRAVARALRPVVALAGEPVTSQGEAGADMYFVTRGRLAVWRCDEDPDAAALARPPPPPAAPPAGGWFSAALSAAAADAATAVAAAAAAAAAPPPGAGRLVATLGPGDTFGELELFAFGRRGATVRPLGGPARMLALSRRALLAALAPFPTEVAPLRRRAEARLAAARATWAPPQPQPAGAGEGASPQGRPVRRNHPGALMDGPSPPDVDDALPAAGLAHRAWGLRASAAAQQRVLLARVAAARAAGERVEARLAAAAAAGGRRAAGGWGS